jgi:hypothetical protein
MTLIVRYSGYLWHCVFFTETSQVEVCQAGLTKIIMLNSLCVASFCSFVVMHYTKISVRSAHAYT